MKQDTGGSDAFKQTFGESASQRKSTLGDYESNKGESTKKVTKDKGKNLTDELNPLNNDLREIIKNDIENSKMTVHGMHRNHI